MMKIKNCKISKSAVAILLGTLVLTGCSSDKDVKPTQSTYTDGKDSEITKNEQGQLVSENQNNKDNQEELELKNEQDIINYFSNELAELSEYSNDEPLEKLKEKWYQKSTAIGDFIIEGETYKHDGVDTGITFDSMSDYAKQQIVNISMNIDNKMVEYFPDYPELKEYVSQKVTSIKSTIKDTTINIIGEDMYEQFGNKKDEVIEDAKNLYSKAKQYTKKWYSDFKDKHNSK